MSSEESFPLIFCFETLKFTSEKKSLFQSFNSFRLNYSTPIMLLLYCNKSTELCSAVSRSHTLMKLRGETPADGEPEF